MKPILFILIATALFSCQKENQKIMQIDVSKDIVIPKHYIVSKTKDAIKIDGLVDEPSWKNAKFTDYFIDIEGVKKPKYNTRLKMLWDTNNLYVYAELKEPHIWADLKQRDTVIFYNNDFEVFIDPSGNGKPYGEIELNALNTVWDLLLNKAYRVGGYADNDWNVKGLKSAVKIDGTLNNAQDIDKMWTVEMAIPLRPFIALKEDTLAPVEGEQWRINFSRVEWDFDLINNKYQRKKVDNKFLKEYNWVWSNQKVVNMHEPEKWGYLQFTESNSIENTQFISDKDLLIKQTAFALFRKTRFGDLKYLLSKTNGFFQNFNATYEAGKSVKVIFTKNADGFEFMLQNKLSGNQFSINQEGNLKNL